MGRSGVILICWLVIASGMAGASPYALTDGTTINGEPVSINDMGVQFKQDDDTVLARTPWDKLTPKALRDLLAVAKTANEKQLIGTLLDSMPQDQNPAPKKEIIVNPITPPARPTRTLGIWGLFGSPVGLLILLILYCANLFAAFEVAIYRFQRPATVCGWAAIPLFGVLSPIIFLAMPPKTVSEEELAAPPAAPEAEAPPPEDGSPAPPPSSRPAAARERRPVAMPGAKAVAEPVVAPEAVGGLPEPIVFTRADFLFNRRFFETKFAGFFRIVPSEAEKDLVLLVKAHRGDFVGRRITRATATELCLQVFNNEATADEVIPFTEITEVQIRHKDSI
jgi:hypothetical protein